MESFDDGLVQVELKYRERCGGWLRSKEETEIYCPGCVPRMAKLARRRRKRVLVVAVDSIDEMEACLAELAGVCGKEATHDGGAWFSGSIDRIAGVVRGGVGLGKEPGHMVLPCADGRDPAAFFLHVGGDGKVSVDPGAGVFPQQGDFIRRVEFRGRGDLRA